MLKTDVAIVGAGPAGLSLAASLSGAGLNITVLEQHGLDSIANPMPDGREIALTHLSARLMKQSGAWQKISDGGVSEINKANVVDGDSDYALNFDGQSKGLDALGYMVPNYLIRKACYEVVADKDDVTLMDKVKVTSIDVGSEYSTVSLEDGQKVEAKLVIGADSRFSATRRMMGISADMHDFGRSAIVCRMRHTKPHNGVASECFHYGRTLAILPLQEHLASVVITVKSLDAANVMALSADDFSEDVADRYGHGLGDMELLGERYQYPLVAVHAKRFYAQRFALVGDAAVGMHPVTAHGFNLGLRGQDTLAELVKDAFKNGQDIASEMLLRKYHRTHWNVARPLYLGTNGIVGLFTDDRPGAKLLRKGILRLSSHIPPLKNLITRQLTEVENRPLLADLLPGFKY